MHHCTEYKLSALQSRISEETTINAMTKQFLTAKISGCTLKQGSKAHSSLRQKNLQLQNQAAPMPCRLQALEHSVRQAAQATSRVFQVLCKSLPGYELSLSVRLSLFHKPIDCLL